MNVKFCEEVIEKHKKISHFVSNNEVKTWVLKTIVILFPSSPAEQLHTVDKVQESLEEQKAWLIKILRAIKEECQDSPDQIAAEFFSTIPKIYKLLKQDIDTILKNDPAARSELEVIRSYPGFYALSSHRIAHQLHKQKVPLLPRIISESAHAKSGIDIHPGAQIGRNCLIDHGTGIVIG